jgi:predicted transposase YbfD/YdcC
MNLNLEQFQESLYQHFGEIADPRQTAKTRHKLLDIITIAILAVLCGADNWVSVVTYGQAKQDWLKQFLELPNGIPSHDTFGQVFSRLDPEVLEARFQDWVGLIAQQMGRKHIALDGKTVRGSYDRENKLKALQLVSAYCSDQGLVLGQCAVTEKSNEITAIPVLLEQLEVKGAVITADALNTQKSIANLIQDKKADYILALKGNHQEMAKEVRQWWEKNQKQLQERGKKRVESGHHRLEKRQTWAIPAAEVIRPGQHCQWSGLKTIVINQGYRGLWNKETQSVRFFLSSLPPDCEEFEAYIRNHWSIENKLHWCLDVVFREDSSRIRQGHGARNMSLLRRLTLNILRQDKSKGSLTMKRYKAGLNNDFLISVLLNSGMF